MLKTLRVSNLAIVREVQLDLDPGLTVLTGALSETLKMETRVLDLVPGDDPAAIEYNEILRQYSSASQLMIGIEGKDREQMIAFADELDKRAKEATYTDKETGKKKHGRISPVALTPR